MTALAANDTDRGDKRLAALPQEAGRRQRSLAAFAWRPALLVAALVLAGCVSLPELPAQPEPPAQFVIPEGRWLASAPAEAQDRGTWWRAFDDPVLDGLVERAGASNTTLREAAARWVRARAIARRADADRMPQLSAQAGAARQAGADTAGGLVPSTLLTAGLTLSYEADLSGRLARVRDASQLDAQAQEALLRSTRLAVQAETAQVYLALRAADAEHALLRETVAAHEGTLRLTQRRRQAGDLAELDVVRVQSELAATQAEALALERRRSELQHALAVLVGEAASDFQLPAADWRTALPRIPAGVPAKVLARRPDVSAAQASLLAAQARAGAAKAAWLPDVALTVAGGFASPDLGDLLRWSARSWGVGALLSLPVFDGGRREAATQAALAQLDEASAAYRGQVLVAVREVQDQLSALRLLHEQAEVQARAVSAAARATALSESRYRHGLDSQLELLDARRSELRNRRQALQVQAGQYQATVGLIRALGGGWEG